MCSGHSLQVTNSMRSSRLGHTTTSETLSTSSTPRNPTTDPPIKEQLKLRSCVPPHVSPPSLPPTRPPAIPTRPRGPALCPCWCSEPRGPDPEPRPQRSQLGRNITAQNPEVSGQSAGISTKLAQMSLTAAQGSRGTANHAPQHPSSSTQSKISCATSLLGPL